MNQKRPWLVVDKATAVFYSAYLASVFGRLKKIGMDPITDEAGNFPVLKKPTAPKARMIVLDREQIGEIQARMLEGYGTLAGADDSIEDNVPKRRRPLWLFGACYNRATHDWEVGFGH